MPKAMKRNPSRLAAARHEAAHAVVAHALGFRVGRIALVGERRGFTVWGGVRLGRRVDPLRYGVVAMAGANAERGCPKRPARLLSASDVRSCERLGFRGSSILTLNMHAAGFVAMFWEAIDRVAVELVAKGELTTRAFNKVVGIKRGVVK